MGLEIVAEGVETQAQQEIVTRLACDRIQGYIISEPLLCDDVVHFLSDYKNKL